MPVQLNFAMLELLAKRPGGCASLDELCREWEEAAVSEDTGRYSEVEGLNLVQAGLVVFENDILYITEAGRLVLRGLEGLGGQPTDSSQLDHSLSLKSIDDLIGTELRMKIFDLELRAPGELPNPEPPTGETNVEPEATHIETDADADDEAEVNTDEITDATAEFRNQGSPDEIAAQNLDLPNAPSFLKRNSGFRLRLPSRLTDRKLEFSAALSSQLGRFSRILRGHLAEGSLAPNIKPGGRPAGISGALLAALSLVVILIAAGLFIGINQIKALKSEITGLERQLALKKQTASTDQQEKKSGAEPKDQLQDQPLVPAPTEKGKNPGDNRAAATALILSPDEIRLIREYIKPAPFSGPAVAPINVGDSVTLATIPLPSPLTDKVPKLLGGRFTIRNGAIIILKRDSRQADAVLAPN
jgi:hypothetical protein